MKKKETFIDEAGDKLKEATEMSKGLFKEFKVFISRGNVIDLAVGVIIGGAFGKIVTSLVNDLLMPLIGTLFGGINFTSLKFNLNGTDIMYGSFLQNVVDFLIIAACVFLFVKVINKIVFKQKKEEEKEEVKEEPKKSDEVILLEEIRDLLKKNK